MVEQKTTKLRDFKGLKTYLSSCVFELDTLKFHDIIGIPTKPQLCPNLAEMLLSVT